MGSEVHSDYRTTEYSGTYTSINEGNMLSLNLKKKHFKRDFSGFNVEGIKKDEETTCDLSLNVTLNFQDGVFIFEKDEWLNEFDEILPKKWKEKKFLFDKPKKLIL